MYTFRQVKGIDSVDDMMNYLKNLNFSKEKGPVAIVGGHFMLLYDQNEDNLKPVIYQDLKDEKQKEFARKWAGDFPVKTFEYSLELIKYYRALGIDAENVFIVNDHKFQASDFQPNTLDKVKNKGGQLRRSFYWQDNNIPASYLDLILNYKFESIRDVISPNVEYKRNEDSILPKESIYYSEQVLRKKFEKSMKKLLRKKSFVEESKGRKSEVFFENNITRICITENGKCGCSSEVMEFIWQLMNKNYFNIIMFIPEECEDQVNNGIEVALQSENNINEIMNLLVITGIGGLSGNINFLKPKIFFHHYIPKD